VPSCATLCALVGTTVTHADTFFVMFINAAHRETLTPKASPAVGFTVSLDAAGATVIVKDGNNNVVHYLSGLPNVAAGALAPKFVELPTGSQTVFTLSSAVAPSVVFNASQSLIGASQGSIPGTANHYYLCVLGTSPNPATSYNVHVIDVTPDAVGKDGVFGQQVINLFEAGSSQAPSAVSQSISFIQQTAATFGDVSTTACRKVQSISAGTSTVGVLSTAIDGPFDNTYTNVFVSPSSATCTSPAPFNALGAITLGQPSAFTGAPNNCGVRVTLLVGRPYTVTTTVCTTPSAFNATTCLNNASPQQVTTTFVGDLTFLGDSLASPTGGSYSVATLDIQSCECAATTIVPPVCDTCDVLAAVNGLSSGLRRINGTTISTHNIVKGLQKYVHKKL